MLIVLPNGKKPRKRQINMIQLRNVLIVFFHRDAFMSNWLYDLSFCSNPADPKGERMFDHTGHIKQEIIFKISTMDSLLWHLKKNFEVFINLLPCYSKTINGRTKGYKRKIRLYDVHTYHDLDA